MSQLETPSLTPDISTVAHDTDLEPSRVLKDPVWDLIGFDALTWQIIDTPHFQRLRYLKQLGTSYFVFPGASHNRFEHCIGTCHLARQLVEHLRDRQPRLDITARDIQCVTIAGLCHDLGHGPFSHVFDGHFIPAVKGPRPDGSYWCHEEASEMMLDALVEENSIPLSKDCLNFIKDLIRGEPRLSLGREPPEKPFLFEIVSNKKNGIDVDKWDYIARDTKAVGETCTLVAARLIEAARVINGTIAYNWKDAQSVYELYYSRYSLHKRIYSHKTAKAMEHMIVAALIAAEPVLRLSDSIEDPKEYLHVTDSVIEDIERSKDPRLRESKEIIQKLRRREIPKRVEEKCLPWEFEALWKGLLTPQTVAAMSRTLIEDRRRKRESERREEELYQPSSSILETTKEDIVMDELTARDDREDDLSGPLMPPIELHNGGRVMIGREVDDAETDEQPLAEGDVIIDFSPLHFGMKEKDPLEHVPFYSKENPNVCIPVRPDESGYLRPERFQEVILRCYAKDASKRFQVQAAFRAVLETLPSEIAEHPDPTAITDQAGAPTKENTPTAPDAPSTPPAQAGQRHRRTASATLLASAMGASPDGSPRGRGSVRRAMTPHVTVEPNSFTTIQRPAAILMKGEGLVSAKKRRRAVGDEPDESPERKKKS